MTDEQMFQRIATRSPIVPVLVIEDAAAAAPLGMALEQGGALAVEVTLRTPEALTAIAAMKTACPNLLIGAGTVLSPDDVEQVVAAGVDFIVTPGTTPSLIEALQNSPVPVCPGVASASEAMALADRGFSRQKFFPAEAGGGANYLKALSGPMQAVSFMPTGGVSPDNLSAYLALPNVFAVGGSWIAPAALQAAREFDEISHRMRTAVEAASWRLLAS